jgi:very-short-patch-repair endonuclease
MVIKRLPKGVYKHKKASKEARKNMALSRIGTHRSLETHKKMSDSAKQYLALHPRTFTAETRKRISIGVRRAFAKPDVKLKRHLAQLGNKNFLGHKRSAESKLKQSQTNTGRKFSKSWRHNIGLSKIGNTNWLGKKHSKETRDKMALSRTNHVVPYKDTKIEKIVQRYLKTKGMKKDKDFETHKSFCIDWPHYHQVDAYLIRQDMAIECDGIYWHSRPGCKERDFEIDSALFKQGINVIRLSEENILSGKFAETLDSIIDTDLMKSDLEKSVSLHIGETTTL